MASENANTTSDAKEEEGEGAVDGVVNVGTPTVDKDAANSTPDITPSRRSARKKQTTFSSDFEYYTPTGRKKEIKEEDLKPGIAPATKGRKGQKKAEQKQNGDKEEVGDEEEVKEGEEDDESRKPMKRKVALRKKKGKAEGKEEDEEEEAEEKTEEETPETKPKAKRGRPKGSVKKQVTPIATTGRGRKKKIVKGGGEDEEENEEEEEVSTPKTSKASQKRKKMVAKVKGKGKKAKLDEDGEDDISSDEEEDTPISQLKAQIGQDKLEVKKMEEVAQNLTKKLAEAGSDTASDQDKSPIAALKRKLVSGEKGEEVPSKKQVLPKSAEKPGPAPAGEVKRAPPADSGLVKRTLSEGAAKADSAQKTSQSTSAVVKLEKAADSKETPDTVKRVSKPTKVKTEDGVTEQKKGSKVKAVKKEKDVKVEPKFKPDVKKAAEIKVIKKADGTIIRGKVIPGKGNLIKTADGKIIKIKVNQEKGGDKVVAGGEKAKSVTSNEKGSVSVQKSKGHISKLGPEKSEPKAVAGDNKQKNSEGKSSRSDTRKPLQKLKKGSPEERKRTKSEVEDLLKRGIIHKKKSHQPFGNKKVIPKPIKDVKAEPSKDQTVKEEQQKKKSSNQKSSDKREGKKAKDTERRKSSDASKYGKDRSHSADSSKGERRKSSEGKKKSEKTSSEVKQEVSDDGPPPLLPANAVGSKPKPKHHNKPEHEVPVDMTMMDLFKPDGLIVHDQQKKEEGQPEDTSAAPADDKTQDESGIDSYVKPEHVHHVLIEHQYSKPSSPAGPMDNQKNLGAGGSSGRDEDFESVSHKQTDFMDVTLPDQILDESDEMGVQESHENFQDTWPTNMEELQQMVKKSDPLERPSILESLDTELKESGSEFRIVGQVEVERVPAVASEESVSSTTLAIPASKHGPSSKQEETRKKHDSGKSADVKSSSDSHGKPSAEKRKDSTDKQKDSTEKGKDTAEKRKDSSSTDKRKDSTEHRKDSTEKRKKSEDEKDKEKRKPKKKVKPDGAAEDAENDEDEEEKGHESDEHAFEDDEDDFDWEPNDPDAQYCICRKPHNNRFMICCDKCEEWFHGTCVGITRARGKEMEEKEEEYVCPVCVKGEKVSVLEKPSTPKGGESPSTTKPKLQQKCIGRKCNKTPRPGSVYCSNECIMSHAQDSLKALREEQMRKKAKEKQESSSSSSSSSTKPHQSSSSSSEVVEVVERETGKVLKGSSAPTQKGLHRWLEQHPSFEVVQPHRHRSSSSRDDKHRDRDKKSDRDRKSSSDKDRKPSTDRDKRSDKDDRHRHGDRSRHDSSSSKDSTKRSDSERRRSTSQKSDSSSSSRQEEKKDDGPNQIRLNVRTALRDSLTTRAQEADDIMLSSTEIKSLAVTIEEELFALFNDTGHKYRTKYRSLVFNIKDQKNKGLFRKILTGKIKPHKLVQMSTEDLASRELAKWREQESKHQLEMIEKTEQEALKQSETVKHVRKKTHKGEVEVEDEDLSILETRIEEKKDPEPESQEEQSHTPAIDTTDQHRAHLFDLNCKVCTGKIVPGPEEQAAIAAANKLKVASALSEEEPKEDGSPVDKEDYIKAEEIVKEALKTMQKTEQEVSSLPKIVSTSPKEEEIPLPPSPKISTPGRESTSSSSSSSSTSKSSTKKVVVRSPDSALQSGLEAKPKFTPTGPMLWKGFVSMLDVAKFFTSAYRVSGPTDHITIPDTIHIMGRISPDHMWDYLSKIRQAGSQDLTIIRFIPGSDDEKVAYVHLYSYLNSRSRCGVAGNPNKQVKDFYVVPLASHSKIPRTLLPFDGPGLEENRPHMLIGILVRQRGKHGGDSSDSGSSSSTSKTSSQTSTSTTAATTSATTTTSSSSTTTVKKPTAPVNRDPRLAKLAAQENNQPKASPAESTSSSTSASSSAETKSKSSSVDTYEPEYVPMPIKPKGSGTAKPVAEYIPTPTAKKKDKEKDKLEKKIEERTPTSDDSSSSKEGKEKHHHHHGKEHHHRHHEHHHHHGQQPHHHHHHHHHHHKKHETPAELEDDSEPYSPSKEAEPYSPGQEAAADEPYDPEDESLMDDDGIPIVTSSSIASSSSASSAAMLATPAAVTSTMITTSSAAAVVAALSGSISATHSEQPVVPAMETVNSTDELVEQMARSNDPQEISSLMVTALSAATSPQEQQKLLVELTKRVEERKLQLAETARKGISSHDGVGSGKTEAVTKTGLGSNGTIADTSASKSVTPVSVDSGLLSVGAVSSAPGSSAAAATVSSATNSAVNSSAAVSTPFTSGTSETAWNQSLQSATPPSSSSSSVPSSSLPSSAPLQSHSTATSSILSLSSIPMPQDTKPGQSSSTSAVLSSTAPTSLPPSASSTSAPLSSSSVSTVSSIVTSKVSDLNPTESRDSRGIKFSFTKSFTKTSQPISSQAANAFSTEASEPKPKLPLLGDDSPSRHTDEPPAKPGPSGEIPDALKALMDDVMGNTQVSSLEKRRKMLLKKEAEKAEKAAKELAREEGEATQARQLEEDLQAEAKKRLEDEMEARRILDSMKKTETTSGSSLEGSSVASVEHKAESTEAKPTPVTTAPSIDELLDRLKKGGFQFPPQTSAESGATTLTSSSSVATSALPTTVPISTTSLPSSVSQIPLPSSSTSSSLVSSSNVVSTTTSSLSAMDVDMRQKNGPPPSTLAPPLPPSLPPHTTTGDSKTTQFSDYDARMTSVPMDRDDRAGYEDRDERLYRPPHPPLPKHPLDPHAFPPLPSDSRGYPHHPLPPPPHTAHPPPPLTAHPPPPHTAHPPPPHSALHSHYPPPSSVPPYHPTPRSSIPPRPTAPKGRAQPPPPGTEFDKPAGVLGITKDFPPSDVDLRNRNNRPPLPPDQPLPPLPPQPPPPLPPLPGNRGPYPHPPPGDMDYRGGDHYGPPPPHHSDYRHHGYPGRGRPYHRH